MNRICNPGWPGHGCYVELACVCLLQSFDSQVRLSMRRNYALVLLEMQGILKIRITSRKCNDFPLWVKRLRCHWLSWGCVWTGADICETAPWCLASGPNLLYMVLTSIRSLLVNMSGGVKHPEWVGECLPVVRSLWACTLWMLAVWLYVMGISSGRPLPHVVARGYLVCEPHVLLQQLIYSLHL